MEGTPPYDIASEQAVLGSIIQNNSVFDEVSEILKDTDFYRPAHMKVYGCMSNMRYRGVPIDTITLRDALKQLDILDAVGSEPYLLELQSSGFPSNVARYSNIVRNASKLRQIISIGTTMSAMGYAGATDDESVDEVVGDSMSMITSLALAHQSNAITVGSALQDLMKEMRSGRSNYITPPNISKARMEPGDLVVVAAGTSVGKTAITLDWCDEWSKTKHVTYFEYEMPAVNLVARLVCKHAGVDFYSLKDGNLTKAEMERVEDATADISTRKLRVEEVWCNIDQLCAKIRKEAQQGVELIVVDHLHLIPYRLRSNMTEASAIGKLVTAVLKRLASELSIIIVLLVQLNRDGQQPNFFPTKRHLKSSGDIENDASVILMLWSEVLVKDDLGERIKKREESGLFSSPHIVDDGCWAIRVGVEKQRNGAIFSTWGRFIGENFRYEFPKEQSVLRGATDEPMFVVAESE